MYWRTNTHTFFLTPAIAVGLDGETGLWFFEIGWLCWAVGVGKGE